MRRLFDGDGFLRDGKGHKNNLLIDAGVNRFSVKGLTAFLVFFISLSLKEWGSTEK